MDKRKFLKSIGITSLGLLTSRNMFASDLSLEKGSVPEYVPSSDGVFKLPALGYNFNALEPNIDAQTMEIHYTRHHQGYVDNLNKAINGKAQATWSLDKIIKNANNSDANIRNNAGGHYNHSMFWEWMTPDFKDIKPGALLTAINNNFGSFEKFQEKFTDESKKRFGSGWTWLVKGANGKLYVYSTPNQDNPLMAKLGYKGAPLLGLDVWEHAYYLKYQNKRADYIANFWKLVNWDRVAALYGK